MKKLTVSWTRVVSTNPMMTKGKTETHTGELVSIHGRILGVACDDGVFRAVDCTREEVTWETPGQKRKKVSFGRPTRKYYSRREKLAILEKYDRRVSAGYGKIEAAKALGVPYINIRVWKQAKKKW